MKLKFITFFPLSSNAGHLARLSGELEKLSKSNEICILCLGKKPDDEVTKYKYKNVSFLHNPIQFEGWEIKDQNEVVRNINGFINQFKPDLVILQMEIWDLMRELGKSLNGKTVFATVVHAMPFLVAPISPTGDFEKDVVSYANSGIERYRKDYLLKHYKEVKKVFKDVHIIANNKTVAYYFNTYFKNLPISVLPPSSVVKSNPNLISSEIRYDFVYMARIEKGKGLEYLADILKEISLISKRKVKIAVLGRTDDSFSKLVLERLTTVKNNFFEVNYMGWADSSVKESILPHCGVFLYPSFYDNYPTVVNEALSFGLPVVTWNVPFSELNYSNTNSVKRAKLLNFKEFVDLAIKSLKERDKLSIQALDFIDSFDLPDKVADQNIELFESIILRKNG